MSIARPLPGWHIPELPFISPLEHLDQYQQKQLYGWGSRNLVKGGPSRLAEQKVEDDSRGLIQI